MAEPCTHGGRAYPQTHRKYFSTYQTGKDKKVGKKTPNVGYVREHAALYNTNGCNQWVIGATLLENNLSVAFKLFTPQPLDSISFLGIYSTDSYTNARKCLYENVYFHIIYYSGKELDNLNTHQWGTD